MTWKNRLTIFTQEIIGQNQLKILKSTAAAKVKSLAAVEYLFQFTSLQSYILEIKLFVNIWRNFNQICSRSLSCIPMLLPIHIPAMQDIFLIWIKCSFSFTLNSYWLMHVRTLASAHLHLCSANCQDKIIKSILDCPH